MAIYKYAGGLLRAGGGLANDANCCCDRACLGCCDDLPATLYATVSWCGVSVIELNEVERGCTCGRVWRGVGQFGGGPGEAQIEFACGSGSEESSDIKFWIRLDGCTGNLPGDGCPSPGFWGLHEGTCSPLLVEKMDAPPSLCGAACTDPFTLAITE